MDCLDIIRDCSETLTNIGLRAFKFIQCVCVSVCVYDARFLQTLFVCMGNCIFYIYTIASILHTAISH